MGLFGFRCDGAAQVAQGRLSAATGCSDWAFLVQWMLGRSEPIEFSQRGNLQLFDAIHGGNFMIAFAAKNEIPH